MTEPMITASVLRDFWTIVFIAVTAIWAIHEARQALLNWLVGEVLPPPQPPCVVNQPLGEEVGEWYMAWTEIEGGGPYDWVRIEHDLEQLRALGACAMFEPQP